MLQAELLGHMRSQRRRAVALTRVVATSDESHAGFCRQMRLGFRDFTGDVDVGTRSNRSLKVALRAAGAPRNSAQQAAVTRGQRGGALKLNLQSRAQCLQAHRLTK
jgi:hypothetical protein